MNGLFRTAQRRTLNRRHFISSLAAANILGKEILASATVADESPSSVRPPRRQPVRTAGIQEVRVRGGKYNVWTKRIGSGALKVLLLHGGPGIGHEYLEAFESFLPGAGIEMYYYDQLGCNNSDVPKDTSLWTLEGYLQEIEEVRKGLGLDHFVLYGHSWGGILGIEYALRHPEHLRGLVISNMSAGMDSYLRHINWWRTQLPVAVQRQLDEIDRTEAYDTPLYAHLMETEVYPRVICRLDPWPEPVRRAFRHLNEDIYVQMQGRSEFLMTGNLKGWDRWSDLARIKVRTLTIGSRYDEMDPADMRRMAQLIPGAEFAYCDEGSHLCMWDDQERYFTQLIAFLRRV